MNRSDKGLIIIGIIAIVTGVMSHQRNKRDVKMNRIMNTIFDVLGFLGLFRYIGNWNWLNKYVNLRLR